MLYNNSLFQPTTKPHINSRLNNLSSLNKGLVGFWPMLANMGSVFYDYSGNHHDANSIVNKPTWDNGKYGPALRFINNNDYIIFNDASLPSGNSNISIFQWIKTSSIGNALTLNLGSSASGAQIYIGQYDLGAGLHFIIGIGGNDGNVDTNVAINDNKWHQIGVTYNNNSQNWKMYLDGKNILTTTIPVPKNTTLNGSGYISESVAGGPGLSGLLDYTIVYNRTLSDGEIYSLYYNPLQLFGSTIDKRILFQSQLPLPFIPHQVYTDNFPFAIGSPFLNTPLPFIR